MALHKAQEPQKIGIVLIGRNEGKRLLACLESLPKHTQVVYVDSGSEDNSINEAKKHNAFVVELDMSTPFTAARARNAGWKALLEYQKDLDYIQFIDGDCSLDSQWLTKASHFLATHSDYAIACGRRRELRPDASFYNWQCDYEWATPVGDANACGGDFLIRTSILQAVGGFRDDFIAGEEPEMCLRIRQAGSKIARLDLEMTSHDADIHSIKQWWRRAKRCGYAYALSAYTHFTPQKLIRSYKLKETLRSVLWGGFFPFALLFGLLNHIYIFAGLVLALVLRLALNRLHAPNQCPNKNYFALLNLLGKGAEFLGICSFVWDTFTKRDRKIIEYK